MAGSPRFAFVFACLLTSSIGCGVLFPSNDIEPPPPATNWEIHVVRANSVGYRPDRVKKVTVVLPAGMTSLATATADVRSAADDTVVWTCDLTGPMTDAATSSTVYVGEFTVFDTPGSYYIAVPSLVVDGQPARSATFRIGLDVFRDALTRAMISMYGQRCGQAVSIRLDGEHWSHAACHLSDANLDHLNGMSTRKPSVGGWHDAGDYGKYITNGAFTVGMMLAAWEHFQPALSALSLPIPETGGATPDFLDEVKWELDWLLTTQHGDGGVSHKVTALDFEGTVMPERDGATRYFTPVGTAATGDFVAVMAQAARIYEPYDPAAAAEYLEAARLGYAFLATATGPVVPDTQGTFNTGGYGQSTDASNRLWAAAELWETTGEAPFLTDLETRIGVPSVDENFDWGSVQNLGLFTYLMSKRAGRDPAKVDGLATSATTVGDDLVTAAHASAFGRAISGYWWGSNGTVARTAMNLWVAYQLSGNTKYVDAIALQLDHLLGRNIYDRTQVTGVGYHPPEQPHHRPSASDAPRAPWPGLLVGGANPRATSWEDKYDNYENNEVAINWSGAFIYATAALTPAP